MILTRDLIVTELRPRSFEVLVVPDDLSAVQTIDWINARARFGDVALEIHADAASNPSIRGSSVFYIANNTLRRQHADLLLLSLLRRVPQLPNRGAKPDTATGVGSLAFCRSVVPASLLMQIGFLTSPDDRFLIQNRRREIAVGIADGLDAWSRAVDPGGQPPPTTYPPCNISINGQIYAERGIIVSGNAFIPIDLADRLGVDVTKDPNVRRITYGSIVYIKSIDLRNYNVSVNWDSTTRTVLLRSTAVPGDIDRITGKGKTSEVQLMMFLKSNNEAGLTQFPEIAQLYREEGDREVINYDIAFCQMCVETNFLRFGGSVKPSQNNFANLGSIGGGAEGASFPSARIGVRAHIQHLKAYANTEPLAQEVVDPRFDFVARGIAPLVGMLSGRWNNNPQYGEIILARLKQLYEQAGLM